MPLVHFSPFWNFCVPLKKQIHLRICSKASILHKTQKFSKTLHKIKGKRKDQDRSSIMQVNLCLLTKFHRDTQVEKISTAELLSQLYLERHTSCSQDCKFSSVLMARLSSIQNLAPAQLGQLDSNHLGLHDLDLK